MTRDIKLDTEEIRLDTAALMMNKSEILSFLRRLQTGKGLSQSHNSYILQRYLDELTSCSETTYQDSVVGIEENSQALAFTKIDTAAAIRTGNLHDMISMPPVSESTLQQSNSGDVTEVLLAQPRITKQSPRKQSGKHQDKDSASSELRLVSNSAISEQLKPSNQSSFRAGVSSPWANTRASELADDLMHRLDLVLPELEERSEDQMQQS